MDRVLDRLWIGSSKDLLSTTPLRSLGFVAVLDLRDAGQARPLDVTTFALANRDGDPWAAADVNAALAFVYEHVRFGRVLVACGAGMSRSTSMVIGFLVRCGWDAPSAYEHLRRAHMEAAPSAKMVDVVLNSCGVHEDMR